MDLLIDIGNTRIKWATLDEHGLSSQQAATHATWSRQQASDTILQFDPPPHHVLVANVAGERMSSLLREALQRRWGLSATFIESSAAACGVRNRYSDPQKLGVDRWLGIIAAHAMESRAACVVNVGTAMTVDGVSAEGVHLGGVIVPGVELMVASLMRNTSEIPSRAQEGSVGEQLFADNTLGAVHQGALNALAALIERAIDAMRLRLHVLPAVLLTGGGSQRLASLVAAPCVIVPDLILRGLAVFARESLP